jgi:hypothetical protein
MKLQSKFVWKRFAAAIKIDRIPLFDVSRHCHGHGVIGRSTFIIVFFPIRPAVGLAGGRAVYLNRQDSVILAHFSHL